jgi:predicted nucleic acid-binding protein
MTAVDDIISRSERVAIDTAPIIYFVESNPHYVDTLRPVFQSIASGRIHGLTSTLTLTELLVHPLEENHRELVNQYRRLLTESAHFTLAPVSVSIAAEAAQLRADYGFRTPDSLQLAAGLVHECDVFLTNDRQLTKCNDIDVVIVDELE